MKGLEGMHLSREAVVSSFAVSSTPGTSGLCFVGAVVVRHLCTDVSR